MLCYNSLKFPTRFPWPESSFPYDFHQLQVHHLPYPHTGSTDPLPGSAACGRGEEVEDGAATTAPGKGDESHGEEQTGGFWHVETRSIQFNLTNFDVVLKDLVFECI